jgi:hypothetical protein
MTTDTIRKAARAAFSAYFALRIGHQWDTCGNATQIRFEQLAARVLNGEFTTARQCHHFWNQGHAYPVDWSDISTTTRDRWVQAWWAMIRVRDAAMKEAA